MIRSQLVRQLFGKANENLSSGDAGTAVPVAPTKAPIKVAPAQPPAQTIEESRARAIQQDVNLRAKAAGGVLKGPGSNIRQG